MNPTKKLMEDFVMQVQIQLKETPDKPLHKIAIELCPDEFNSRLLSLKAHQIATEARTGTITKEYEIDLLNSIVKDAARYYANFKIKSLANRHFK